MPISIGTRFGAYEVTSSLGSGGMGEVYRARDTNLKRDVAIKVLPAALANDADRLARFQREAEVLASLNQPNIAQIYGLERSEGTTALAMELIEGQTLQDRISQGPIPIDEALRVAAQIAEALDAAHERGIVHRDLKPANIKLRSDGTVKVLDFGIAKALDPRAATGPGPAALTTPAMTEAGMVLGTAAYMSPEQARGKPVDRRTDIWAFGCVLYEMLTGRPAFLGEDVTTTLALVLQASADWAALPSSVPPAVRRTLELCLEKDVRKRIADIRDVQMALAGAFDSTQQTQRASPRARAWWWLAIPMVAGVLIGGAVVALGTLRATQPVARPVSRFKYEIPPAEQFVTIGRSVLAVSPDGSQFVYSTANGLNLRALDSLDARLLPGTTGGLSPFFSPDGKAIGFAGSSGRLERVGINGGAPVAVADWDGVPSGASWAQDGSILYGQTAGIYRVKSGGHPDLLVPAAGDERLYGPELLPDGDTVLFSATPNGNWRESQIIAQSLSSGRRTVVVERAGDAHYVGGYLTFVSGDDLFAVRFNPKTLQTSSDPARVGVRLGGAGVSPASNYAVAENGTLVYVPIFNDLLSPVGAGPVWIDRDGHEERLAGCPCTQGSISPDGTRVAFTSAVEGTAAIAVWSLAEHALLRVSFEPGLQYAPVWTRDGTRIAYGSPQGIFWRRADGTGSAEPLLLGSGLNTSAWTRDGKLIFTQGSAASGDIYLLSVSGERTRQPLIATKYDEGRAALSPDGHWLAYQSNESGRYEIYVRPFPDVDSGKWPVSTGGGEEPRWSRDGRTLFFINGQKLLSADVATEPTFSSQPPQKAFDLIDYQPTGIPFPFDVSPDGKRILLDRPARRRADIVVVQNWLADVEQRARTSEK
jgi:eukaryotic-like serine/threonine-protein kinase